jgi:Domain of unknown function DUF29
MPGGVNVATIDDDPFAWALTLATQLRHRGALKAPDREALSDFLEEWAAEMWATVRSQMVSLLAHAAKVANTRNPDVIGHWRTECIEFHDRLIDAYRPSMRDKINIDVLWHRAQRKVCASFDDNDEPRPTFAARCPVDIAELIDPDLDLDRLVATVGGSGDRTAFGQ